MKRYSPQPSNGPRVTFWGAARSVTGSMHLVEAAGRGESCSTVASSAAAANEVQQRNIRFPFSPAEIDAVMLSHAHMDHCGNLPNLVHQGFSGPIYCTPATRNLTSVMLGDSARVHEHEAVVAGVVHGRAANSDGLHTRSDARRVTAAQCVAVPYNTPHEVAGNPSALRGHRPHPRLGDGGLAWRTRPATAASSSRAISAGGPAVPRGTVGRAVGRPAHLRKHLRRPRP